MVADRTGQPDAEDNAEGGRERIVAKMWSDTLGFLKSLLGDLPAGPFGAIVRLCAAAFVLLALVALISVLITRKADIAVQLCIIMFLFFSVSAVVYVIKPPNDVALATAQTKRRRQINPTPISPARKKGM
jgi:hypothetical protein